MGCIMDYVVQEEVEIERSRVYVGDVYCKLKDKCVKERESVILISFGEYFVELGSIKNKTHLNKLQIIASSKFNLSQENNNFLSRHEIEANPYYLQNVKKFFTNKSYALIHLDDLRALAYYVQPNADCCF